MKKIIIPLSGITRNTDDTISSDGDCMELINARVKDNSIKPVGRPILERAFIKGNTPVYLHKNGLYEHVITCSGNNLIYESENIDGNYIGKNSLICNLPDLKEVQSIGNTLIFITGNGIFYSLFIDGSYLYLGDKPDFPEISLQYFMDTNTTSSDETWCDLDPKIKIHSGERVSMNENSISLVNTSFRGTIAKFLSKLTDENKYVYPFVVRYALRLFDGNYIMHSAPLLLKPKGYSPMIFVTDQNNKDGYVADFKYKVTVQASSLNIKYDLSPIEKWKDVISSVDVFISSSIMTDDMNKDVVSFYCTGENISFILNRLSVSEIIEKIENTSNFYMIKSIPVGSGALSLYEGLLQNASLMSNLEQKEILTDDAFTHNTITGTTHVYNSKLHVANTKMKFAPMYPMSIFQTDVSHSKIPLNSEIHIKTDSGIKIIHGSCHWGRSPLSPYISYPDSRAFKLVLYFTYLGKSYHKIIGLKAHSLLNTAYSLATLTPYSIEDGSFTEGAYAPFEENNIEIASNKIKVSSVSNPFFFPAKQTYTVSNGDIVGMATATAALSTGQFGQFPLYVFASDGIYALSVGTESVTYSSSHPVSRDVCTNSKSITSIDNAIVFATKSGLMLLSGSSVQKLSDKIEGYLPSSFNSSPLLSKIIAIPKLQASTAEFKDYIENASVGYIYEEKEIIISNKQHPYSYVYSLQSGEWYKLSVSVDSFLNSYPKTLAILAETSGCGMYNLYNPHRTINNIAVITRPVKFGSLTHKRILQSALRGIVKPSLSDVYFRGEPVQFREENVEIFSEAGFYILGSNDAEHFTLLAGTEKLNDIRDLITKMNKTKAYKYFVFCLVGGLKTDASINCMEVLAEETFENRLR